MSKIYGFIFASIIAVLFSGCATQNLGTYIVSSEPEAATALIRPATQEEKQEEKAGMLVRLFVNPSGQGSIASISYMSNDQGEVIDLRQYNAVRVSPGNYVIRASCILPSFFISRNVPIEAKAGYKYLLECMGNTVASTRIQAHAVPYEIDIAKPMPVSGSADLPR